jgi:hypothetical protein
MSSAASLTVAFGPIVTTFSTIIFLSFCDIETPDASLVLGSWPFYRL